MFWQAPHTSNLSGSSISSFTSCKSSLLRHISSEQSSIVESASIVRRIKSSTLYLMQYGWKINCRYISYLKKTEHFISINAPTFLANGILLIYHILHRMILKRKKYTHTHILPLAQIYCLYLLIFTVGHGREPRA